MKLLLALLLSIPSAWASFPELFGPSSGSLALGNLPEQKSAANNYQASALLGYSKQTQFNFSTFYTSTDFKDINDVVVKNETNSVNQLASDDVEVNPTPTVMFAAHFSIPLFTPEGPKFNLSLIAPFDRLLEADTGDPYQPSYAMYANRFIRPSLHMSLAKSWDDWSYGIGVMTGLQSNGETMIITRTTNGNPSVGKISFNAKPTMGITASIAKKYDNKTTYLAFQQEMKSKLLSRATGETEIGGGASFPFDFKVDTLLYYDPMTLQLGHQIAEETYAVHFGLEFQQWDKYEASTLKLKKQGGDINGSENYEKLRPKNIFIPRLGFEKKIADAWTLKTGYFFRPTPLKTKRLKHAGNSIDADKHVASTGVAYLFKVYGKGVTLDVAYQLHLLETTKITKTSGQENGSGGDPKIGSPGYTVGGKIHVLTAGLSWMY